MYELTKYSTLNSRQKENYNFHKMASELAEYGYNSLRLNDDWQGADFLAIHVNGNNILRVQLKSRFTLNRKYEGKDLHVAFIDGDNCYVYPHDAAMNDVLEDDRILNSKSWLNKGRYSWNKLPRWAFKTLESYKI